MFCTFASICFDLGSETSYLRFSKKVLFALLDLSNDLNSLLNDFVGLILNIVLLFLDGFKLSFD